MDDLENRLKSVRRISLVSTALILFAIFILDFQHIRSRRLLCLLGILLFSTQIYIALRYGLIWSCYKYVIKDVDKDFWLTFGLCCVFIIFTIGIMIFLPDS